MSEPLVFLHDAFIPLSQASLPLYDAGFVMGVTITDLCRTFAGRLYRWNDHLRRFRTSCALADLPLAVGDAEISAWADRLVTNNVPLQGDVCLVLFATPGLIGSYLGQSGGVGDAPPTFGMITYPVPEERNRRLVTQGVDLFVPSVRAIPGAAIPPTIKHRSRMHWWLAERETRRLAPGTMALLLDEAGLVTETAAANVLIVRAGEILSPRPETILPGVSLHVVREFCAELSIPFRATDLTLTDCLSADEMFLTNTAFCLAGVRSLNGKALAFPGALTVRLQQHWLAVLGVS